MKKSDWYMYIYTEFKCAPTLNHGVPALYQEGAMQWIEKILILSTTLETIRHLIKYHMD